MTTELLALDQANAPFSAEPPSGNSKKSNFLKFIGTPFEKLILPIIPVGATISEGSSLVAEQLGKIPGSFSPRTKEWYGYAGWQTHRAVKGDLQKWQGWQEPDQADTAIALATRLWPLVAIDIDVDNEALADKVEALCKEKMGTPLCVRLRVGSARRVLIYISNLWTEMPIHKSRTAFTHPFTGEAVNAIEVLGYGQQVVLEGPHAKGEMHYWRDDKGLLEITPEEAQANFLTCQKIIDLNFALVRWVRDDEGGEIHIASGKAMRDAPLETFEVVGVDNPFYMEPADRGDLVEAMQAIDLNDPRIDYYRFIDLNRALCSATGCDRGFLADKVWPWACTQTKPRTSGVCTAERGIEWLDAKWEGFKTSALGADYVIHVATLFGYTPKGKELSDDTLAGLFGAPQEEDNQGDGDVGGGDAAGQQGGGGGSGPLSPGHSPISLRNDILANFGHLYRYIDDFKHPRAAWVKQVDGLWLPAYTMFAQDVSDHCEWVGDWYRKNGGKDGAAIDRAMRDGRTHNLVEHMLGKTPGLVVRINDFDTNDDLLNTPNWVIDLRSMQGYPHDGSSLFRMRTKVSPDWGLKGPPVRWLKVLERLSAGRPWLPEVLQIWFGYCLTGHTDWQFILFMPGISGTGKSIIIRVIDALMGTYSKSWNPERLLMRKNSDDRFGLDDIPGKRAIVCTEMKDNSVWNETRIIMLSDGEEMDVEIKGGGKPSIKSHVKFSISGNNEPRFPSGDREGGMARRLMRLYFDKQFLVTPAEKDTTLLTKLVDEEGEQIMTWLLMGAWKALNEGPARFQALAMPLFEAAKVYADESDPLRGFLQDRHIVAGDPEKDNIGLATLYRDYLQYRKHEEPGFHIARPTFKNAMADKFEWEWEVVGRGEPDKNRHGLNAAYGWKYFDDPTKA